MLQVDHHAKKRLSLEQYMRLGQVAHAEGDDQAAHYYWQQAALLDPTNEQVWTALMWVLESEADRRVCLRNILAINPDNHQAQTMLDELIGATQPQANPMPARNEHHEHRRSMNWVRIVLLSLIYGIGAAMSIVLLQMLF